jgi:hypothetical protein
LSLRKRHLFHGEDFKTRETNAIFPRENIACQTLQICNDYGIPSRRLEPRLLAAAAMKWMKWIGRSLVERAAATTFPDLRRRCRRSIAA